MSFKVTDLSNDGTYTSDYLTIFTEVLQDLTGTGITNDLTVVGSTYTLTYTVDATTMEFTGSASTTEEFLKNTLKTLVQDKIEADLA